MAPTKRMKACIGILATALNSRPCRLAAIDLPVRYRCTWDWSVPKYARARNIPPKETAPKVVAIIPVELGGHHVQFSSCACKAHRIGKRDMGRQEEHRAGERRYQSHRHHEHLQCVRPGGCLYSTLHRKDQP